jgi:Flp pilus assembly protein TadG
MRGLCGSDGQALVEFAVACLILIPMIFGFIEICLALYSYNFVYDAAREATRYAMVRGSTSCANTPQLWNCGITTAAPIQTYVQSLGFPGARNLTATVTWLRASTTRPTTWTACGTPCTQPGNEVQVQVRYNFPIGIPFWRVTTIDFASKSTMVITQ